MFNEVRVAFSLDDLPEGESIALSDVEGFIPYLIEKRPGGRRRRVEISGPGDPRAVDGSVMFRFPPPEQEVDPWIRGSVDPDARVIDWDAV